MFLKQVRLENFRNYDQLFLEISSAINVFTGDNGQGKSSFLEALFCALRGKSFQNFVSSEFIQSQKKQARVYLSLKEDEGVSEILATFYPTEFGLKKEIFYCGKKVSPMFVNNKFCIFLFTEASMKSLRQGFEQRRVFVDDMLSTTKQSQIKKNFSQSLKQKKILLKNIQQGRISLKEGKDVLYVLNRKFLENSILLVKERLTLLKELFVSQEEVKPYFFNPPFPKLSFSYSFSSSKSETFNKNTDVSSVLEKDLKQKEEKELLLGQSLFGPQKHEITFLFKGENSRSFCSKGEQRSFVLSLMASHIQKQKKALLFLDDVLLELDETKQHKLLQFLEQSPCQSFLTNCTKVNFKSKKASFFFVKKGQITKEF